MERGETDPAVFNWFIFTLGKMGRHGAEPLGCGTAGSPKAAGTAAPSSLGTTARGDVNGSKSLGWSKAGGCCWQSLEGFSYFKKCTTTVSLGLSECAVCTSCTVPVLQRLRKPRRNSGTFLLWQYTASFLFGKLTASKNKKKNSRQRADKDKTDLESLN